MSVDQSSQLAQLYTKLSAESDKVSDMLNKLEKNPQFDNTKAMKCALLMRQQEIVTLLMFISRAQLEDLVKENEQLFNTLLDTRVAPQSVEIVKAAIKSLSRFNEPQ